MVGGALTAGGGPPDIYLVGGNAAGAITTTAAVRVYNPISDTITTLTSDPWPGDAAGDILPGGFAVFNDKLYILGGFQVNTGMTNQIWEFDPNGTAGNRWHRKTATLPVALGYIPAATIGNYIYTAGGSQFSGGTLIDTDFAYRYDPVADSITPIARIPRPTGETRAVNLGGRLWVLGGGRVSPNPSNEVDVYEPGTNTWTIGPSFLSSRRSFPADSDGSRYIWLAGGYNPGKPLAGTEIFTVGGQCGSPTSTATPTVVANTPTRTATGTPTVTATATLCTITFSDVHPSDYFYPAVTYLYCHGVIYGYGDNTFRPYNNTTRGQMSKIVTLGFGLPIWTPEPSATPTFRDVPRTDAFFDFIETAAHNQIVSGYGDGTYRPYNNVTRGQLCKIVVLAAAIVNRWPIINPPTPTFNDVPIGSPFYTYIETAYCHGIISGYGNGSFRPGNETTRGQISKIEHLAILDSILCKAAPVVQ